MDKIKVRLIVHQHAACTHMGIQNAGHYVSNKTHGHSSQASKEVNKDVAKDSHAPLESRAAAAKDAASDKVSETGHKSKAEGHKGDLALTAILSGLTLCRGGQTLRPPALLAKQGKARRDVMMELAFGGTSYSLVLNCNSFSLR